MGNKKNKRKSTNLKLIEETQKNMAKDAEELCATDEEIHADVASPSPLPVGSSNRRHTGDSSSEEEDEDDVLGECPAKGKRQIRLLLKNDTQPLPDVDITFDYPAEGGMMDSVMLSSSLSWIQFQEEMCTVMELCVKDLKLGYKFSTHPQRELPWVLSTPAAFIKMKDSAVACIHEREKLAGKGKTKKPKEGFRVILIDSGKKAYEKATPMKGKVWTCMFSSFCTTDLVEYSRKQTPPGDLC